MRTLTPAQQPALRQAGAPAQLQQLHMLTAQAPVSVFCTLRAHPAMLCRPDEYGSVVVGCLTCTVIPSIHATSLEWGAESDNELCRRA